MYICSVSQSYLTLCDPMNWAPLWDFPFKNTGVDCHFLLQFNNNIN